MEIVADVINKWSTWPEEFRHGVHLCAKLNYVYVNISNVVSSMTGPVPNVSIATLLLARLNVLL